MRSTGIVSQLEEVGTKISAGKPEDTDVKVAQEHEYDVIVIGGGVCVRLQRATSYPCFSWEIKERPAAHLPLDFRKTNRFASCC